MKQIFLMTVGYSQTGKTTLTQKIMESIPGHFARVRSDDIRDFINKTYPIFKDDNTVNSKVYWLREDTVKKIQATLVDSLAREGVSLLLDACNMVLDKRTKALNDAKAINPDIKTVIIRVKIPEEQMYNNLRKADETNIAKGENPAWIDLYEKVQKNRFEEPGPKESDYFFIYNWDNIDEVVGKLKEIIK